MLNKAVKEYGKLNVHQKLNTQKKVEPNTKKGRTRRIFLEDADWIKQNYDVDGFANTALKRYLLEYPVYNHKTGKSKKVKKRIRIPATSNEVAIYKVRDDFISIIWKESSGQWTGRKDVNTAVIGTGAVRLLAPGRKRAISREDVYWEI